MPTFTLNFSRPGNQVAGQYYSCIRLGRDGTAIPVLASELDGDPGYTVFDIPHELRTICAQSAPSLWPGHARTRTRSTSRTRAAA